MNRAPHNKADDAERLISRIRDIVGRRQTTSDFDLDQPGAGRPTGRDLTPAAVLVPLFETARGPRLLLTKRSSALRHHPGQIAFPGGRQDPADASPMDAALREAREEIGLDPAQVEILGPLDTHQTVTGYCIHPFVGLIHGPFTPGCQPEEVAEAFDLPLSHVLDLRNYVVQSRRWRGRIRHYYTVPWGPYYIWGATARILHAFARRMQP